MSDRSVSEEVKAGPQVEAGPLAIPRPDRAFVRVHGRDPLKMVQGLITNDMMAATAERAVYAGLLTPKGKLIAELRAYRRGDDVLLETDAAALDGLLAHFRKFVPPLFARFEATPQFSLLGVYGPGSAALLTEAFGVILPKGEDEMVTSDGLAIIRTRYAGGEGWDLLTEGDAGAIRNRLAEFGAEPAGHDALELLRIEAGSPRWGFELDENIIPLEAGLRERMISETKGCYTGQEVIIRILHRGHVNRHLRGMLLGDVPLPAKDTPLLNDEGKPMGRVTSAVASRRLGQTIGLGYARRELTLPARLHLGDGDGPVVAVVELPFEMGGIDASAAETT